MVDDLYAARRRVTPPLPWPTFAPPFSREVPAESRTIKGNGVPVPYLHTLRWVVSTLALPGVGVTSNARLDDWRRGQQ